MKKKLIPVIFLVLLMILGTAYASAGFNPLNIVYSEEGDIITDKTYDAFTIFAGNDVNIKHDVLGTAIVTGNNIVIDSNIDGDLIALGRNITINGNVGGNLYSASDSFVVEGSVLGDTFNFCNSLSTGINAVLGRDAHLFAATVSSYGEIKRDAAVYSKSFGLYGSVGRNLNVSAEDITINDGASIAGNFSFESGNDPEMKPGSSVGGSTQEFRPPIKPEKKPSPQKHTTKIVFTLGVAIVFWAFLLLVAPGLSERFASILQKSPGKAAGFGAILLFILPIACIILLFTVIGIPLSVILGILYAIMLYLAFYVSAGAFGIVMFKTVFKCRDLHKNIWYILAGVLAVRLLKMLPYVGWIISLAAIIFGFGIILLLITEGRKKEA